jgi:hypothetical protein
MKFFDLLNLVENVKPSDLRLYLIIRNLKDGIKKSSPLLDKFEFTAYQIDIDAEIRQHFYDLTHQILEKQVTNEVELHEYDVITDDTEKAFTYSIKNKALSFSDVVLKQLKGHVPKIKNLEEVLKMGELWAYCVGFSLSPDNHLYTFRKFSLSKIAVDSKENPEKSKLNRILQTQFNTSSKKLELIHGQTMSLDKHIDCIYYQNIFYVIQKTQFEHIVGMSEEFKETSSQFLDDLETTKKFEGLDLLRAQIDSKPAIHRKLSRLAKLENHKNIDQKAISNMQAAAKLENKAIKIKNGKFLIEDEEDIDLLIKMLAEFYKTGMVFGKKYGTFSGKVVSN